MSGGSGAAADGRDDTSLLRATIDGDRSGFSEFYLRHSSQVFAYFRSRCPNAQDAYDLAAETFAQAYRSLGGFDAERGEPVGWLFGIARNTYRRSLRNGAIESRAREQLRMARTRLTPDDIERLEHDLDLAGIAARLHAAIDELPASLRDAVRLRWVDGLDYEEVASRLRVRPAAARKRVSRGLEQLAELLGDNPFTLHDGSND